MSEAFIDEECAPHPFRPVEPCGDDDERGPIWCADCAYHRDHAVHQMSPAEAPNG